MAGNLNRVIIAFSVPTLIAIAFLWLRRRSKEKERFNLNQIENLNFVNNCEIQTREIKQEETEKENLISSENVEVNSSAENIEVNCVEQQTSNMQIIECAKSSNCSKEADEQTSESIPVENVDSDSTLIEKIIEESSEIIDIVNNNIVNTDEIKLKDDQKDEKEAEAKLENGVEGKVSPKLFSECFQTEKSKCTRNDSNPRTRRETSGSGFVSCSSEAGSHNGNYSDIHSEGSCDSGKGGSDIQQSNNGVYINGDSAIIYQFELPQQLCGLLIGKQGFFINSIKEQSDVNIVVNRHPYVPFMKICTIEGRRYQVKYALQMIRKRFPLAQYPNITLRQINVITPMSCPIPLPQSLQLILPDSVTCDVILSCTMDAGHFFLQQPTHPTYPSLSRLDQYMTLAYSSNETPQVPTPTSGIVCAVKAKEGWFRAAVVHVYDDEECEVKFVDYGGYSRIKISELRQIRVDFMTLPFQACECYLANVKPTNEDSWSADANLLFEYFAQGQILQANIVAYSDNNIPYVHLYMIQGASTTFINRELVNRGFARWIENM